MPTAVVATTAVKELAGARWRSVLPLGFLRRVVFEVYILVPTDIDIGAFSRHWRHASIVEQLVISIAYPLVHRFQFGAS
jgi:hypothetical protein